MSALSELTLDPIATEKAAGGLFSFPSEEPKIDNSADNSSSPQQHSDVLFTQLPYDITGIKNIFSRPPAADKIDIAVEKLKKVGLAKSANRINYLRSTDDLEEGDQPLTAESVVGFAKLMYRFRDLGEPMLGLFSEGTLSVEWRIADDKHLLIEPLDDKNASFAFIGPANKPGEEFHLDDRGTIEEVINTLRIYGVDRWKENE